MGKLTGLIFNDENTPESLESDTQRNAHLNVPFEMSNQSHKRQQSDEPPSQLPAQTPLQSVESSTSTPSLLETPETSAYNAQRSLSTSFPSNTPQVFRVPQSPRTAPNDGHRTKAAKIAIPRLKKTAETASKSPRSSGRHRVNHACEPCRQRKTKCSGERPVCTHCQDFKIACFYADGKRDRAKKYIPRPYRWGLATDRSQTIW